MIKLFAYICIMKKELGKWLMDIAKYITTAVILTSVFGDIKDRTILYIITFIAVSCSLGWGLWLVSDSSTKKQKKEDK